MGEVMQVKRLGKENYDEIVALMNAVFSRRNGREMDFERELPKMCVRDEEHMRKHFGIFDGGRLVACLGVYPLETVVNGEKLLFSTTGNVVTHWDYEGKGYMEQLLRRAMEELEDIRADASRLGGLRSRYNRFSFEACGQRYGFHFTAKNRERKFLNFRNDISFTRIEQSDAAALQFAADVYNANEIAVTRTAETAYPTMTAWQKIPYLATRDNRPVGYVCANEAGTDVAEIFAVDTPTFTDVVCAWQKRVGDDVYFYLQPHQADKVRIFSAVCEASHISSPSHFYIRNWEKVVGAFLRLKATYCPLPKGEKVIEIQGYGRICIFVNENAVGCEKTEKTPDLILDRLTATRYIFGLYSPVYTGDTDAWACAVFPLPLSWNGQDRV